MSIELDTLRLKLIETQAALLQYQHQEVTDRIKNMQTAQAQAAHDQVADMRDMPSGATKAPDEFAGS